jgi:tetratricopeptide (TPR) repeat protein
LLRALGLTDRGLGLFDQAVILLKKACTVREAALGPDHADALASRNNLAIAYQQAVRLLEAIALYQQTLELKQSKLGPDQPDSLESRTNLAQVYESLGQWTAAESLQREILARRCKTVKPDSPLLADDSIRLGQNLLAQLRRSEAEPLLRQCLRAREKAEPNDWSRYAAMRLLGESLAGQGRFGEAEPVVVAGYEGMKEIVRRGDSWGQHRRRSVRAGFGRSDPTSTSLTTSINGLGHGPMGDDFTWSATRFRGPLQRGIIGWPIQMNQ